jgi:hypothetical protein
MTNRYHLKSPVDVITTSLFIPQEYQQECIQEAYRLGDSMEQKTNVKALMSTYWVWKQTKTFNLLISNILNFSKNLFPIKDPKFKYYMENCWTAIYNPSHYSIPHTHHPYTLSFVYYLQSSGNTPLIFDDCNFKINPTNDMLVLFPGYLTHSVPVHQDTEDRIVVAGNLHIHEG